MSNRLRKGWTTGACAAAAARAACLGFVTREIPNRVTIQLPNTLRPEFSIHYGDIAAHTVTASVIKDAGDDPDVTHGAEIIVSVNPGSTGHGLIFQAGIGVGMVTRPGLPLAVGSPAINPGPRAIIISNIDKTFLPEDLLLTVGVTNGIKLAKHTLNARLGIIGGLSILGTTGVVIPYSCSAWIASIHQGVDVARASGLDHIAGVVGRTSEKSVRHLYKLPETALIPIGNFLGTLLKYLCYHPIPRLTIAGGFAKLTKLACGVFNLHSSHKSVDLQYLTRLAINNGASSSLAKTISLSDSANHALVLARAEGINLALPLAKRAHTIAKAVVGPLVSIDIAIFDSVGSLLAIG